MTATERVAAPPPMKITRILHGNWAIQALKAGVSLNIFGALSAGPFQSRQIAEKVGGDERGVRLLCDALVSLELLNKKDRYYSLNASSELYLTPTSPLFLGDYIQRHEEINKQWQQLDLAIKEGRARASVNQEQVAEDFFPTLAEAIFPMHFTCAEMLAAEIGAQSLPRGSRALDLAAGSAVWTIPMAQANSGLLVDALDFPSVLKVTRKFVERYRLDEQYSYLPGNWRDVELDQEAYDIIVLGHILHSEGLELSLKLIEKCYAALKKGGKIIVGEFLCNTDRTAPPFALLFALNMYLMTDSGCAFSSNELLNLLKERGFCEPRRLSLPYFGDESPVVIAYK